jgi:hypothetical protein
MEDGLPLITRVAITEQALFLSHCPTNAYAPPSTLSRQACSRSEVTYFVILFFRTQFLSTVEFS